MPRLVNSSPRYCLHKATGQAIVRLCGRDYYLGPHGTHTSRLAYDKLVAHWLAHDRSMPQKADRDTTIAELIASFWEHAKTYYASEAGHTGELWSYKMALKPLRILYADTQASDFGPLALSKVRESYVAAGWSRKYVNRQVGRIKQVFKWGTEKELVPAGVYQALECLSGLRQGKTTAKELPPVEVVSESLVAATLAFVAPPVKAMIELQMLTGMRPGEVCQMRGCDVDTTGKLWLYRPHKHKTQHRGHERTVYLGEKCKEVLRPMLKSDVQAFLFSPADADAWWRAKRAAERKTPISAGNIAGSNRVRAPKKSPGLKYTTDSYRRAIARGCDRGNVQQWHPNQLRHTYGTKARKEYGLEAAQVLLGHKTLTVTQVYAEKNIEAAMRIVGEVG